MLAPIFRNGSTTRAIGRRLSDASPSRVADTRLPARTPARRRVVVPEFAQSSGPCGVENPRGEIRSPHPDPSPRAGETGDSLTPRLRRQATVALTSSPGGSPVITLSPSARAPRISARCAIDLSPGTRSVPATRVAGSTSSTTPSSTRRMDTSAKEVSHPIAAVDALPVIAQDVREGVDRLNQRPAVRCSDVLVRRGVTFRKPNHAAIAGTAKLRIGNRPDGLRVGGADGAGQVAEKCHLPVVSLGRQDFGPSAHAPHQAKPLVERGELLPIDRRENPGLPPEQRGVALAQPAPLLPSDRMAAEELGRLRQAASPFQHGALDTGDIGDDGGATDNPGQALEDGPDLVDRRGHHHEVAIGQIAKIGRCPVDRPSLLRRDDAIRVVGHTAHLDGLAQPAQRKAERATDQTEPDNADPHYATPAVRLSADATASTCSTSWPKPSRVGDC